MNQQLYQFIWDKKHHALRRQTDFAPAEEYCAAALDPKERMTRRFEQMCRMQTPVILENEQICFMRTAIARSNEVFTEQEWRQIRQTHTVHELGYLSNLSPDYEGLIRDGLMKRYEQADPYSQRAIRAILELSDRYRDLARQQGREDIATTLEQVPRYGARNFREALQMFRILHFALWLENNYHNTVGRFDQYMYPYLQADMQSGVYTFDTALELLEDFFLSFNKDSDLYVGQQQGDNGQSMVLGGQGADGEEIFNDLTRMCLIASEHLKMIDPKINLRVSHRTPLAVYELGSRLTRAGLGFPQYSNDDVVIPALERMGYAHEDAVNYVVAACWEFIIPRVGGDVANIAALSFPKVIDRAFRAHITTADSFYDFYAAVVDELRAEVDRITDGIHDLWFVPSPFMNVCMTGGEASLGGKYNNFGIHGTGIATAADSLAAIRRYVYEERSITPQAYLEAVESDFATHPELLPRLRYEAPKMGQNEALPDEMAVRLLDEFAAALRGKVNCRGGCYRAGTGSAMYYLWHANELGASPDGRRVGEPLGTNFSPSLFARTNGPFSVIRSFVKPHFENAINGGPLTLEFHNSTFAAPDCIHKVAMLVKSFVDMGGHQLQLNAVNLEAMRDAQLHPERHRQLVVRIWGWSAYFVELDREFQDHVIARQEYTV